MRSPDDTIVALSTPAGRGAIAMLRLSGPEALLCALEVFRAGRLGSRAGRGGAGLEEPAGPTQGRSPASMRKSAEARPAAGRATPGRFVAPPDGDLIDSGYLTYFRAPRSYTGQDVVELTCHASPVVVQRLLEELARAGARPAGPGEFTYRAVLHGRMDLAQAEGVRDLIEAGTRTAAAVAARQVRGDLSRRLDGIKEALVEIICRTEAAVEFSEEPDVQADGHNLAVSLASLRALVRAFLGTYREGRLLREGASVVLAGRPNAGKSSLFNRLLDSPRAIVDSEPGTTRDFLVERIDVEGIPVQLVDTAGLREATAEVERVGVDRSKDWLARADLVLLLCPADEPLGDQDVMLSEAWDDRCLTVASKCDRPHDPWMMARPDWPAVSAATGEGVARLRERVARALMGQQQLSGDAVILTHARHHAALESCAGALDRAAAALEAGMSEEVPLADLHVALRHLSEITDPVSREDLHDRIFSTFCVGK